MRIMAIDYSDDHTGIAISDHSGFMAGTTTIINAYRSEQEAEGVKKLAEERAGLWLSQKYDRDTLRMETERLRSMLDDQERWREETKCLTE